MNGTVDDDLHALLEVQIGSAPNGGKSTVLVWIGTAFNGGLVLPRHELQRLGLKEYSSTQSRFRGDEFMQEIKLRHAY